MSYISFDYLSPLPSLLLFSSVIITSLNDRSHVLTCLLRSLTLAYTGTCTRFLNMDAASAPICCLRAARSPYHITANALENAIALVILFTFNIYIRSFSLVVPQLETFGPSCTLFYELLSLCSLLTASTESTLSLASVPYIFLDPSILTNHNQFLVPANAITLFLFVFFMFLFEGMSHFSSYWKIDRNFIY
jgi:hypothetical protein